VRLPYKSTVLTHYQKFGSGSKQLIGCSGFAKLKDLQNLVHSFDPAPNFFSQK